MGTEGSMGARAFLQRTSVTARRTSSIIRSESTGGYEKVIDAPNVLPVAERKRYSADEAAKIRCHRRTASEPFDSCPASSVSPIRKKMLWENGSNAH